MFINGIWNEEKKYIFNVQDLQKLNHETVAQNYSLYSYMLIISELHQEDSLVSLNIEKNGIGHKIHYNRLSLESKWKFYLYRLDNDFRFPWHANQVKIYTEHYVSNEIYFQAYFKNKFKRWMLNNFNSKKLNYRVVIANICV